VDSAFDVAYQVVDGVFGPGSGVPWWAWIAPVVLVFWAMLLPVMAPSAVDTGGGSGSGSGKKGKKSMK
jgi:hypothetical protein